MKRQATYDEPNEMQLLEHEVMAMYKEKNTRSNVNFNIQENYS